ncbi:prolipoprotein diacylglyceryl transferase [Desulforamulus hydrothermalis]|uniref:Phosphatidylglycerol--prolipoprotein diacylglyceryl transferase n=1 Tax=Desulforamulus hydrothermalis Lam5 = DSM 18033 TaxID=1121428 RepID=K8DYU2_9FIRM|nr:prolipoprotein diacylglyceryl transferase [Desulforamulus hydrothermalis]CCO07985.1 Prolipoprotein diacylglyceryl transferase [Desulforamulus hydrothermalis Lam5 = DSM 18033]SHG84785.1 Prolipoprotein diacylglyceryl transferase [Desulforamulus hydrothermalis Lam5 = DSM 18033]
MTWLEISPYVFVWGPISIRWYGLLMMAAVLLGTWLALREARRRGIKEDHIIDLVLIGAPISWLGARLYYVIMEWDYYSRNLWEIPQLWHGGLAIHGGLLTAILFGYMFCRLRGLRFRLMADITAPSFPLGQAIGRWGNFFNQEAYGYPTDLPWAMYIAGAYRHPTFLYESLWNLLVFVILMVRRRKQAAGQLFMLYLGLYSLGRFFIEGFRTDSLMLGPLRAAQVLSILLTAAAVIGYVYLGRRQAGDGS